MDSKFIYLGGRSQITLCNFHGFLTTHLHMHSYILATTYQTLISITFPNMYLICSSLRLGVREAQKISSTKIFLTWFTWFHEFLKQNKLSDPSNKILEPILPYLDRIKKSSSQNRVKFEFWKILILRTL